MFFGTRVVMSDSGAFPTQSLVFNVRRSHNGCTLDLWAPSRVMLFSGMASLIWRLPECVMLSHAWPLSAETIIVSDPIASSKHRQLTSVTVTAQFNPHCRVLLVCSVESCPASRLHMDKEIRHKRIKKAPRASGDSGFSQVPFVTFCHSPLRRCRGEFVFVNKWVLWCF